MGTLDVCETCRRNTAFLFFPPPILPTRDALKPPPVNLPTYFLAPTVLLGWAPHGLN